MTNSITFTIIKGTGPFEVELIGSDLPKVVYYSLGTYTLYNVLNGTYTLQITDAQSCVYSTEVVVDPLYTPTTTTTLPIISDNLITIGNAQDPILIFDQNTTNRNGEYVGYPDANVVTLYLWLRTANGVPLTQELNYTYNISATTTTNNSTFKIVDISDQIHCEIQELKKGISSLIYGNLILKKDFIETMVEYTYYKGSNDKNFNISLTTPSNSIYTSIPTESTQNTIYGINTINNNKIIMNY